MHKILFFALIPLMCFCNEEDVEKVSEAMGHMIGKNLEMFGLDFDMEAIVKGLKDESEGISSPMSEDECIQAINTLQEEKMIENTDEILRNADALSNGDEIPDENSPFSATDSTKYW